MEEEYILEAIVLMEKRKNQIIVVSSITNPLLWVSTLERRKRKD